MYLKKISLKNFRNLKSKVFEFLPGVNIILGDNATGKTNTLEAINYCATGRSFKARINEDVIDYESDLARVKAKVQNSDDAKNVDILEVILTRGEVQIGDILGNNQKTPKKRLLVNGVPRRLFSFVGNLRVVLFGPWDLDLVTESPSIRRKFLDSVLSQVDREYARVSLSYEKGLKQRNRLLWQMREFPEKNFGRSRLLFWDKLLIKNGDYISQKRAEFIEFANRSKDFPDVKGENGSIDYSLTYDKSAISESRLMQYQEEEVSSATTLVGPHRDDMIFRISDSPSGEKRDLNSFGSRGEQRMGVLWLKLAELSFVENQTQEKPVLLLDDIFSELDQDHRRIVSMFVKNQQTIITTADPHFLKGFRDLNIIKI